MARNINVVGYVASTITNTSQTLIEAAATGVTTIPADAKSFRGKLETAAIRVRADGTNPASGEGELINVGDTVYLSDSEIRIANFIRTGSTSGALKGHLFDAPLSELLGGD